MSAITIYSTTTCGYCRMLKSYLDSKGIAYKEKLADQNPKYAQELYEKSGQLGVPFTIFEDKSGKQKAVLGFDRVQIDQLINKN